MTDKFSLESDFVDSFLNSYISKYYKNSSYKLMKNSLVYSSCVNLNNIALKISDCSAARDFVNEEVESNEDLKNLREAAVANCENQVLHAHRIFYENVSKNQKLSDLYSYYSAEQNVNSSLYNCLKSTSVADLI